MATKRTKSESVVPQFYVPGFLSKPVSLKLAFFLLTAVVFLFYAQILDNPITFDTAQTFNDQVLSEYFDQVTWYSLLEARRFSSFTFGLFYKVIGTDWFWHHLLNLLIHCANVVLVFKLLSLVLQKIINDQENDHSDLHKSWYAFIGALVFAVNPLSIYATAYLIQRSSLFMVMFTLLGLLSYFHGVIKQQKRYLVCTVLCYYMAHQSKEHVVMFPAVLLCFHYLIEPFKIKDFLKKYSLVYLALAFVGMIFVFKMSRILGEVYEPHGDAMIESANLKGAVLSEKSAYPLSLITQMNMFFRYIYLWVVPDWRNIYIDIHLPFVMKFVSFPETIFVIAFVLYPFFCIWLMTRSKVLIRMAGFGLSAVWLYSMPEFSVVRLSEQFVLYRAYLWMSLTAFIWPMLMLIQTRSKFIFWGKWAGVLCYLILISAVCLNRLDTFDSDILLWRDNVEKMKNIDVTAMYKGYRPYNNLAFAMTSAGQIEQSIPYYYQALQINPKYVKARSNLGAVLTNRGRFQEAIEHFKKAIELDPEYVDAHVGIGVCAAEQGFTEEAIEHYMNALKVKPEYPDALFNMGNSYLKLKQYEKAIDLYKRAIAQKPNFPDSYHNLGIAYSNVGNFEEAKKAFEGAQKVDPNHKKSKEALDMISLQMPKLK